MINDVNYFKLGIEQQRHSAFPFKRVTPLDNWFEICFIQVLNFVTIHDSQVTNSIIKMVHRMSPNKYVKCTVNAQYVPECP